MNFVFSPTFLSKSFSADPEHGDGMLLVIIGDTWANPEFDKIGSIYIYIYIETYKLLRTSVSTN